MNATHPQEKIINTFDYNSVTAELVEWTETVWRGKIGYAANNTDEPDVDAVMSGYMALPFDKVGEVRLEKDWDACISVNYLSSERPNGVMFAFLASDGQLPDGFDTLKVPAAQFMRIRMCDETAKALGYEPWTGGIPPYEWIGERIAPESGYTYGSDAVPVFEYYGCYNPEKNAHEYCYLYVPVTKKI